MGYYDDHMRKNKKEKSWLLPTALGFILGAIIILLALPALVQANLIPYDLTIQEQEDENVQLENVSGKNEDKVEVTNVNVEINSQITQIVDEVSDAVVGVLNIQNQSIFGRQPNTNQAGTGSGVVYKVDGDYAYIVTNYHVIEGADSVEIAFSNDEQVEAEVIGGDVFTDLAVIRVDASHVDKVIEMGSSENLKVGEPVLAIGNPLGLQFAGSVTQGIVSGKDRIIPLDLSGDRVPDWQAEVIQTDAAINPGNSGGALVNMQGQLIGINTLKIASSQYEGLGFAIPIDIARPVIEDLEEDGTVTRSYMGIVPYSLEDVAQYHWHNTLGLPKGIEGGVIIDQVERVSPADQAGLQQYDVIVALDDTEIMNVLQLRKYLFTETEPGDEMVVKFYRDGELMEATVTLSTQ
ncbi:S1C family serine protease [Bacillaceae bacterium W0354]